MRYLFLLLFLVAGAAQADLAADRAEADSYLAAGDYRKAFKAYQSLAKDGDHHAQFRVSEMYFHGQGVRADAIDAYAWSVLAAESKLEQAVAYSDELLAGIEDQSRARFEAEKLLEKYGKESLQEKADAVAARQHNRRSGACTGSRLACRGVTAYSKTYEGAGTPPPDPAGG